MAPSSRGLGREPLTLETGVRISIGSPFGFTKPEVAVSLTTTDRQERLPAQ